MLWVEGHRFVLLVPIRVLSHKGFGPSCSSILCYVASYQSQLGWEATVELGLLSPLGCL
jgi:hypothetical protein